jgi:hypothetical protein
MQNVLKGLIGLAALAFILAVLGSLFDTSLFWTSPEAYSRASTNLALLAIAASVCLKHGSTPG